MLVAVYYNNKDIRIEERPIPEIGRDELLVKVMASGICGSDVMEWYRIKKAPLVLGHEIAGEIVEVGTDVKKYKKGDRVFVSHHVPCNECRWCLKGYHSLCDTLHSTNFDPGGFAEYIRVPSINVDRGVYLLPNEVSYEQGTFIEPLGCVVRGQRIAKVQAGDTVLIIGSGISGLLHIQLAKVNGAQRIIATDINEYRLNKAKEFGADTVIQVGSRKEEVGTSPLLHLNADKVIICTSVLSAIQQGLDSVERAGTILFFAPTKPGINIPFPFFDLWNKQVTLKSTYAAVDVDLKKSIQLIQGRKINVDDMITHRLSLKEAGQGFKLVAEANESIKVIIKPFHV